MARPIKVGAQSPTKMPNLSACAASPEAKAHIPIEHATETSDAVKNKFSGFIVDFCDTEQLFYSLLKLYENPRVYEKMSLYSRNYAEQYFNQDDISTMHVNFIKDEK